MIVNLRANATGEHLFNELRQRRCTWSKSEVSERARRPTRPSFPGGGQIGTAPRDCRAGAVGDGGGRQGDGESVGGGADLGAEVGIRLQWVCFLAQEVGHGEPRIALRRRRQFISFRPGAFQRVPMPRAARPTIALRPRVAIRRCVSPGHRVGQVPESPRHGRVTTTKYA